MRIIILVPITFISYHVVIYNCYYMLLPHKTTVKTLVKTKRHCHIHDMNMERNSELQEIDIKNGTFQYFDDIININHKKNQRISSYGKCMKFSINFPQQVKTHCMGRTWQIRTHTFPLFGNIFPIWLESYGIFSSHGKYMGFPSICHSMGKWSKMSSNGEILGNCCLCFSHSMGVFYYQLSILWYTSSCGKCLDFPINFLQQEKMQQNFWHGQNLENWYSYFFLV